MVLEGLDKISEVALPLCALYLLIFCNFTKETLACRLQEVLDKNIYAKHLICFILLFFLIIMADSKNMEQNIFINIGLCVLIYIVFIITTKLSFKLLIVVLILLLASYIIGTIAKKKKEDNNIDEYKRLKLAQNIIFIVLCCICVIGFIIYLIEKSREYKSNFSLLKFILGVNKCKHATPSAAKII